MHFEQTWRWYGPDDPVSLSDIKQAGATGIVTALHHIPVGDVWTTDEIEKRKKLIQQAGLRWSVVESLPVHENIKTQSEGLETYLANYKQSILNLAACRVDTICYNFMPILDWTRTSLDFPMDDGSTALRYDHTALAAFDLFILNRQHAKADYSSSEIEAAQAYAAQMNADEKETLTHAIIAGLPGAEEHYTLDQFKAVLNTYLSIDEQQYRANLAAFLQAVVPVAENCDVRMAIHPDDPPFSIFGLPRIVSTEADIKELLQAIESPSNGFTLCTGSLGARAENNLPAIVKRLGGSIHFLHLRSVQRQGEQTFFESNHLEGSVPMYDIMRALIEEQQRRKDDGRTDLSIPLRPDHGHTMNDDARKNTRPGYPCVGRLRGLAELRGLETGIRTTLQSLN